MPVATPELLPPKKKRKELSNLTLGTMLAGGGLTAGAGLGALGFSRALIDSASSKALVNLGNMSKSINEGQVPADDIVPAYVTHGAAGAAARPFGMTLVGAMSRARSKRITDIIGGDPWDEGSGRHYAAFAKGPLNAYDQYVYELSTSDRPKWMDVQGFLRMRDFARQHPGAMTPVELQRMIETSNLRERMSHSGRGDQLSPAQIEARTRSVGEALARATSGTPSAEAIAAAKASANPWIGGPGTVNIFGRAIMPKQMEDAGYLEDWKQISAKTKEALDTFAQERTGKPVSALNNAQQAAIWPEFKGWLEKTNPALWREQKLLDIYTGQYVSPEATHGYGRLGRFLDGTKRTIGIAGGVTAGLGSAIAAYALYRMLKRRAENKARAQEAVAGKVGPQSVSKAASETLNTKQARDRMSNPWFTTPLGAGIGATLGGLAGGAIGGFGNLATNTIDTVVDTPALVTGEITPEVRRRQARADLLRRFLKGAFAGGLVGAGAGAIAGGSLGHSFAGSMGSW